MSTHLSGSVEPVYWDDPPRIPEAQPSLFPGAADGPETCDEGHCWT